MRLTSSIWFSVFNRTEMQRNAYVSILKKGAEQAGAIFVLHNHLDGTLTLYAPAPQSFMSEIEGDDRHFECVLSKVTQEEVDDYLARQMKFDPDLWVIETESGDGNPSLKLA